MSKYWDERHRSEDYLRRSENWRRHDYTNRICLLCGFEVHAPVSRIAHVYDMHCQRCKASTPAERDVFKNTGRWPKKKAEGR